MNSKLWLALVLTVVWFAFAASCSSDPEGARSPEAVAAAMTRAMENASYDDLLPLFAPKDRDIVVATVFLAVSFSTRSKDDIVALERKFKLDPKRNKLNLGGSQAEMRKAATDWLGGIDRREFLADLVTIRRKQGRGQIPHGKLTELEVEGDRGSAKLGGKPVRFVRERGKWYLALPNK